MPYGEATVAPFRDGRWLFSHNGLIRGLAGVDGEARRAVAGDRPADPRRADRLRAAVGPDLAPAARGHRRRRGRRHRRPGRRVGRARFAAQRPAHRRRADSSPPPGPTPCMVRRTADSITVARNRSVPGPGTELPDRSLLLATATTVSITPMEGRSDPDRRPPHAGLCRSNPARRRPRRTHRRSRNGCHRSGSTTPAAASSSRRSPDSPSTTRPAPSARSCRRAAARSPQLTKAHTLVELGSGSSEKTRLLLDGLRDHGTLTTFVPLDVSETALREASAAINADYPTIDVHGVVGDFTAHLDKLPGEAHRGWSPSSAARSATCCPPSARPSTARSAMSSNRGSGCCSAPTWSRTPPRSSRRTTTAPGVTAEFNRNVLRVLNRQLGADFDVDAFEHVADLGPRERVDRDAPARRPRDTRPDPRDPPRGRLRRRRGSSSTEISAKFRRDGVTAELAAAGFAPAAWWTDTRRPLRPLPLASR